LQSGFISRINKKLPLFLKLFPNAFPESDLPTHSAEKYSVKKPVIRVTAAVQ
jgi:hypothetical protein